MQRLATFSSCLLLLIFTGINGQASQCKDGWFGYNCQYQCHCLNNLICHKVTGDCPVGCDRQWFGPQCQYLDAAYSTSSPLTDGIESTCGTDLSQRFHMSHDLRFTWMKFVTNRPGLFDRVNITFFSRFGGKVTPKFSLTKINSSDTVLYLYGELEDRFKTIRLDFDSPETRQSFCSMQVSSGRNVAIKQNACQSTTWPNGGAEKAVDGGSTQTFNRGSCTSTKGTEAEDDAYWTLNLSLPVTVNMYTILNRVDPDLLCRLRYFRLETYLVSTKVQQYDDPDPVDQNSYDVYSLDTSAITSLKLTVSKYYWPSNRFDCAGSFPVLNFCEMQIYGDVVCPPGKWGRDCEKDCKNCQDSSDSCFVSTGLCVSCKAGFYETRCQEECPDGQWGVDCLNHCDNCLNGKCNKTSGECLSGCFWGYKMPYCVQECPDGQWGVDCLNYCDNCLNGNCNKISGECLSRCSWGYKMPFCVEECDAGFHGDNCTLSCPANCQDNICNNVDGTCVECVTGYQGPVCNQECPDGQLGVDCLNRCDNCLNGDCNKTSGKCLSGCSLGYKMPFCVEECDAGFHGDNCTMSCPANCQDKICNNVDGTCVECVTGFQGPECNQDELNPVIIVVPVVVGLVVVAALITGICLWRRRINQQREGVTSVNDGEIKGSHVENEKGVDLELENQDPAD